MVKWAPSCGRVTSRFALRPIGSASNNGLRHSFRDNSAWRQVIIVAVIAAITTSASLVSEPVAHVVAANNGPTAVISVDSPSGALKVGTSITLDASKSNGFSGERLSYEWNVYRGQAVTTNTNRAFTYRFDAPGEYLITLQVLDEAGGLDVVDTELYVFDADLHPVAAFTVDTDPVVTPGYPVTFDASTSRGATALTYEWWVDDGNPATDPIRIGSAMVQNYRFASAGKYAVTLIVTDLSGAKSETSQAMTVTSSPAPVATFAQSPSAVVVAPGTAVTFDGRASTGDQITYAWYVASQPGIVSTEPVLEFTFRTAGSIDDRIYVRLDVTDVWGRTTSQWTHISVVAPQLPVATFAQTPSVAAVAVGTKVRFDGSASTGDNVSYAWYVRGERGIVGTKPILDYTFRTSGDYGIELRVTDSTGRSAKKWTGLTVNDARPPVATFNQSPSSSIVAPGTKVTFNASGSTGDRASYSWRVRGEKGVVGTSPILEFTFRQAGDYGVELTVTDASGRISKKWTGITVRTNRAPIATFTRSPTSATIKRGTTVTFNGLASTDPDGDALAYSWFVRGERGVVGRSSAFTYRFATAGTYGVELRVADPSGAISKKWIQVTVVA